MPDGAGTVQISISEASAGYGNKLFINRQPSLSKLFLARLIRAHGCCGAISVTEPRSAVVPLKNHLHKELILRLAKARSGAGTYRGEQSERAHGLPRANFRANTQSLWSWESYSGGIKRDCSGLSCFRGPCGRAGGYEVKPILTQHGLDSAHSQIPFCPLKVTAHHCAITERGKQCT
ncbi:hypothetical protein WMY93_007598 [Mugilogobius chulae]|uniref:Uncharacterized protein n=1 Tax=Mugilogobius chulae TaxID=88201 RepID=A0AAW0PMB3_9GOBI